MVKNLIVKWLYPELQECKQALAEVTAAMERHNKISNELGARASTATAAANTYRTAHRILREAAAEVYGDTKSERLREALASSDALIEQPQQEE